MKSSLHLANGATDVSRRQGHRLRRPSSSARSSARRRSPAKQRPRTTGGSRFLNFLSEHNSWQDDDSIVLTSFSPSFYLFISTYTPLYTRRYVTAVGLICRSLSHRRPCRFLPAYPRVSCGHGQRTGGRAAAGRETVHSSRQSEPSARRCDDPGGACKRFPQGTITTPALRPCRQCRSWLIARTQELYEPLWEEIHARSKANGFRIRSIWMADVAHQGQSSVINEDLLGNDRTCPAQAHLARSEN